MIESVVVRFGLAFQFRDTVAEYSAGMLQVAVQAAGFGELGVDVDGDFAKGGAGLHRMQDPGAECVVV